MHRHGRLALVLVAMLQVACGSSSAASHASLDVRGTWSEVAVAGGAQYPQTMRITSEDLATGKFSGDDAGSGLTFTVTGTITGTTAVFVTTEVPGSYVSNATGTVTAGSPMKMQGTFHDSNQTSGTFTATRTAT